ncbi:probable RNA-binding protein 19 [Penaeus indicus]|uniref:probable RNA-binding protein 19 n=1 Tax=Penaeus indicus TaxID=29960 RepID=UPI00300DABDC
MSRLIVKNLPPSVNIEEFKKHFSERGNITDAKLVHKDGTFRRFGFIGYENGDAAADACNFFNGTYYKQYKIIVEVCEAFGKSEKPLSWREKNKQWKEKERQEKMLKKEEKAQVKKEMKAAKEAKKKKKTIQEQLLEQYKDDPGFGDFLKLNERDAGEPKQAEEDSEQDEGIGIEDGTDHGGTEEQEAEEGDSEEEEGEGKEKLANKNLSDLDYLNSLKSGGSVAKGAEKKKVPKEKEKLYTVIIRTKNMCKTGKRTFTKQNIKAFLKPIKFKSLRIPRGCRLVAYVGFKTEKQMNQALQKDKSFIDGARVQVVKFEEVENDTNKESTDLPWYTAQEKLKKAEPVTDTGSLFIRNLWYSVTEEDLRELLEKYGQITDLNLPICKYRRRAKGFAQVTFMFPEHAVNAMTELDGTTFKGRILHVLPAIVKEEEEAAAEGSSFKEKQQKEKKATAGAGHNWNTLFIGSGAVVDLMSEKYNRSKQEILNSEGKQSVAVNLALGETQIVDETKRLQCRSHREVEPTYLTARTTNCTRTPPPQPHFLCASYKNGRRGEWGHTDKITPQRTE